MKRGKEMDHADVFIRGALAGAGLDVTQAASVVGFSRSKMSALANGSQEATLNDISIIFKQLGRHEERQSHRKT